MCFVPLRLVPFFSIDTKSWDHVGVKLCPLPTQHLGTGGETGAAAPLSFAPSAGRGSKSTAGGSALAGVHEAWALGELGMPPGELQMEGVLSATVGG